MRRPNAEIQAYNDRLAALNEADPQAEEARKARQNQNKLRDLNESYAKQQAENEREMQETLEAYEEQRAVLEEAIAIPPPSPMKSWPGSSLPSWRRSGLKSGRAWNGITRTNC